MPITVNGKHATALLDIGSIVSTMASSICHSLGSQIRSLNKVLVVIQYHMRAMWKFALVFHKRR